MENSSELCVDMTTCVALYFKKQVWIDSFVCGDFRPNMIQSHAEGSNVNRILKKLANKLGMTRSLELIKSKNRKEKSEKKERKVGRKKGSPNPAPPNPPLPHCTTRNPAPPHTHKFNIPNP